MKRFSVLFVIAAATACTQASAETDKKLDAIGQRLASIDDRLANLEKRGPISDKPQPPRQPDANTVYSVPVDDADASRGPRHAKVTIVEAYEYACPYCAMVAPVLDEVLAKRPADVRLVSKQFVVHPQIATNASLAVCAANKQGKFAAFQDALWKSAWTDGKMNGDKLSAASMEQLAAAHKLDLARFKADMAGACTQEIEQDRREMQAIGVRGTPAIYVNGRPYQGPRTAEAMLAFVDEEIKKADAAIRGGVRLEDYYPSLVKGGKKSL